MEGWGSVWRRPENEHRWPQRNGLDTQAVVRNRDAFTARTPLSQLQAELENWMDAEYRGSAPEFDTDAYYGGSDVPCYPNRIETLEAVDRLRSIMTGTYLDSKPLRDHLKSWSRHVSNSPSRNPTLSVL